MAAPAPVADQGAWGSAPAPAADQGAWGAAAPPPAPAADQGAWGAPAPPPAPATDQGAWGSAPAGPGPAAAAAPAAWGQPAQTSQDFAPPAGMTPPETPVDAGAPKISSLPAKNGAELGSDAASQRTSGIFNLDDRAVDQIFEKMGVPDSPQSTPPAGSAPEPAPMPAPPQAPVPMQAQIQAPAPAPTPQPEIPQMAPAAPAAPAAAGGLFNINDSDMDKMFDKVLATPGAASDAMSAPAQQGTPDSQMSTGGWGAPAGMAIGAHTPPAPPAAIMPPEMPMAPPAPPMPAAPAMPAPPAGLPPVPAQAPAMAQAPSMAQAIPQTPPPKVEGIGKLDASVDTNDSGSGRIAAIGKFLLDQKDLEKLGKITEADQGEVKMRILTMEASADLQSLLKEIGAQEKVIGSVIVGHDGLLIANTMPEEVDAESMGVWALGVYMNTEHVTKKMGHDRVHQVVSRTPRGYVVIADFGGGLLVTITDGTETSTLIPLMRKITDLVS
ncbi:MAG: roadblock/LC7 domain-containing protein [Cyanobacteriota/Melainabacteria group bacterium]